MRCDAVENNWTNCDDAFSSNDVYAYANDTAGGGFPSVAANSTSTEPGDVLSHTVSLPAGIVSGNLLLVFFAVDGNPTVTFPAGWTVFFNVANGAQVRLVVAYRQADGTEGGTITVTTSASERSAHASYRITGHEDPAMRAPEASAGATGTNNAPDPAALTPTGGAKNYLWLAVAGQDHEDSAFLAGPTNYLNLLTIGTAGGAAGVNIGSAERELNVASEDPGTFSTDRTDEWAAATVVVHPLGLGPGKNDTAWRKFGFTLNATDVISSVEVGVEWFRTTAAPILNVTVSWDGGVSWATNQTALNKSADDNVVELLDFTAATAWDNSKLNDTNFRVRAGTNASDARLDYVTVRVDSLIDHSVPSDDDADNTLGVAVASNPPEITRFDITNAADVSLMHTQLDVNTTFYFNVTIRDPEGWGDLQWANIHFWYDGGTSEIAFGSQTTGANYRADLNYTNVVPLPAPDLSEWSRAEGNFVYDQGNSSLFTNVANENYTFKLAFRLNNQMRQANAPLNSGPSIGYNDLGSWNAEVRAKDFGNPAVFNRDDAGTGAGVHYEFGIFLFTNVSIGANWDAGAISPGGDATTAIVVVTHQANRAYRMSVWFDTNLTSGVNHIPIAGNVNITAAGDPADAITVDTFFGGLGIANRVYVRGSGVSVQAHNVSSNQETTGVQFGVSVPFATPSDFYVATLTIRVETP